MRRAPETFRLDNGTTLVVVPEPAALVVSLAAAVRVGTADEGPSAGVASLLSRVLGREAEGRTAALLQADVDAFGGFGTEYDGEAISAWVVSDPDPVEVARAAQTLLLNAVAKPRFTDAAVSAARLQQRRDLILRRENFTLEMLARLRARATGSELRLYGDESDVARLRAAQVEAFHARWFRPDRTVVAVHGKVDPEAIRALAQAVLNVGGWKELGPAPATATPAPQPVPDGLRDVVVERRGAVTGAGIAFLAPPTSAGVERHATLHVLDAVLGAGKGSRLFALRDRRALGYEVRSVWAPGRLASIWSAYLLGTRPGPQMRDALLEVVGGLGRGTQGVTDAELTRAKGLLVGQHRQARQSAARRARATAWAEAMGIGELERDYPGRIAAVRKEAVDALAREVFGARPVVVRTG